MSHFLFTADRRSGCSGQAGSGVFTGAFACHLLTVDPRFSNLTSTGAPIPRGVWLFPFCILKDNSSRRAFRFSMAHWKIEKGKNFIARIPKTL